MTNGNLLSHMAMHLHYRMVPIHVTLQYDANVCHITEWYQWCHDATIGSLVLHHGTTVNTTAWYHNTVVVTDILIVIVVSWHSARVDSGTML